MIHAKCQQQNKNLVLDDRKTHAQGILSNPKEQDTFCMNQKKLEKFKLGVKMSSEPSVLL